MNTHQMPDLATRTLPELERAVRGQTRVIAGPFVKSLSLESESDLKEFEQSKLHGWVRISDDGRWPDPPLSTAWGHYCRLAGRHFACVWSGVGLRTHLLQVSLANGWHLPQAAGARVADLLRN
jgi:hypothetical protein